MNTFKNKIIFCIYFCCMIVEALAYTSELMPYFGLRTKIQTEYLNDLNVNGGGVDTEPSLNPCGTDIVPQLVLASNVLTGNYYNDITGEMYLMPNANINPNFFIEKWVVNAWVQQAQVDNVNGNLVSSGKLKGYQVKWSVVLPLYAEGLYRVKMSASYIGNSITKYSQIFCLKSFSKFTADNSVKFEYTLSNKYYDDVAEKWIDYSNLNFYNSIRLKGYFGNEKNTNERVEIEYSNGQILRTYDEIIRTYDFTSGQLDANIHRLFKRALQSNDIIVTDYNLNNDDTFKAKKIVMISGYEPQYKVYSKLSRVKLEFADRYKNVKFNYC